MYKRWRRWAALLLVLAMSLSLVPPAAAEGPERTPKAGNTVVLNGSTYEVSLGEAVNWWDSETETSFLKYQPSDVEQGIVSENEQTCWNYYVLLYGGEREAGEADYEEFWENYAVTVSAESGEEQDSPVSLTELIPDGYRAYVKVTVNGPWSGEIQAHFTEGESSESGTGSGRVSIKLAEKLKLDDNGNGAFSIADAKSYDPYYFYVDRGSDQRVTVSAAITEGTGRIYLAEGDGRSLLCDNRNGPPSIREVETEEQPLLFSVEPSEEGTFGGTIIVDPLPKSGFYSDQIRDKDHYLDEIVYTDLPEDKSVWIMSREGFTWDEAQEVEVMSRCNGGPETTAEAEPVLRTGTEDRYDIKVTVPQLAMNDHVLLIARCSEWYISCEVSLAASGNTLYFGDYAAGFAFQMGDILEINDQDILMSQSRPPEGDGSYVHFHDVMVAIGEKKTDASGGVYYEVTKNMPVSVTVERMWIETVSGPEDTLSFSDAELVTEITGPAGAVPLYSRNDRECAAIIKARVTIWKENAPVEEGVVSIRAAQEVQQRVAWERPAGDTAEDLNAFLKEQVQDLDRDAFYTLCLGQEYHGTIRIPREFEDVNITITGEKNLTKIYGGMDLCGGSVDVIREISFFHDETTESALWGGRCINVIQCVFSGYPVAADATEGFLAFTNGNVFVDNQIGVKVDLSETQQGGNTSPWEHNTFLRNDIAVQVLSFNDIISPYYFRIVDSNFIGNSTDFDLQAPGTVYLYRNYFGKIHPQAKDMALLEYLTALLSAGNKDLHQIVTSNAPRIETGSGSKVVTNPRWKNPEENWWRRSVSLEEIFGSGNASSTVPQSSYENYLTADWELTTQIVNEEAGELLLDDAAFNEAEGEKQVNVVDQSENPLGTWTFD